MGEHRNKSGNFMGISSLFPWSGHVSEMFTTGGIHKQSLRVQKLKLIEMQSVLWATVEDTGLT